MSKPTPSVSVTDTIAWARRHGIEFVWHTALDSYEPVPRATASGKLWVFDTTQQGGKQRGVLLVGNTQLKSNGTKCSFLLDDGRNVVAHYVAGYKTQDYLILHQFPTNFNADGSPRLREDNQRPVDYSNRVIGPRLTYHLKIRSV